MNFLRKRNLIRSFKRYLSVLKKNSSFRRREELKAHLLKCFEAKSRGWTTLFSDFSLMKRKSLAWGSGLVLAALTFGIISPLFKSSGSDYVAQASEYYGNYDFTGILYQKLTVDQLVDIPYSQVEGSYIEEKWTSSDGQVMTLVSQVEEQSESVPSNGMKLIDEYGNTYYYGTDVLEHGYTPGADYCVVSISDPDLSASHQFAFETSPESLEAYADYEMSESQLAPELFIQDGVSTQWIYDDQIELYALEQPSLNYETDLEAALYAADTAPEKAKNLFDLLQQGVSYEFEESTDENGNPVSVIQIPNLEIWPSLQEVIDLGDAQNLAFAEGYQEFVFGDDYQLLSWNEYQSGQMILSRDYLEMEILPIEDAGEIFDPSLHGFTLATFEHPLNELDLEEGASCFNFENQPLSAEETSVLEEDYVVLFENVEKYAPEFIEEMKKDFEMMNEMGD